MPHTLITGPNGFLGATMVAAALSAGHKITGTVRNLKAGKDLLAVHPEWDQSSVDFVEVPDYTTEGVFDEIFKKGQFDYVLHTAAPVLDNPENTDFEKDFEKPSVEGNMQLLRSAAKYGKGVKAIAVTGSVNSITMGNDLQTRELNANEWLPLDREDAIKLQNPYVSYCVGKKLAEKAIWNFVAEEKPPFTITNFAPCLIFAPPLQNVKDLKRVNWSTAQLYSLFNGSNETIPPTAFPAYIDARDLALAHISSLTNPAAANRRFLLGLPISYQEIATILKTIPAIKDRLANDSHEEPPVPKLNMAATNDVFGIKWRSKEQTFLETAEKLLEIEKMAQAA